jgi:phytoene dehydrogenase-like protein
MKKVQDVVIIGAGVAGLTAARHLEEAGRQVLVIDRADAAGGRLRTDRMDGFQLDRGFQVLLTSYEEVRRYLDPAALRLRYFLPGARVYYPGGSFDAVDPLRHPERALQALFSPMGSLMDKYRLMRLTRELRRKEVREIFSEPSIGTAAYLQRSGFSSRITGRFFAPFFGGIFLENELRTSQRMFRFVLKMFSEGLAAVPEEGMEAIPRHMMSALKATEFRFRTGVQSLRPGQLLLEDGETLAFRKLIIAAYPEKILPNLAQPGARYHAVTNLYYSAPRSPIGAPLIALNAHAGALVNNFCVMSDVAPSYSSGSRALLSVSVNGFPDDSDGELSKKVLTEIGRLTGAPVQDWKLLKKYRIAGALPVVDDVQYDLQPMSCRVLDHIYLAGDYLLNPSLDAAMRSGRRAAEALLSDA